VIDGHERDFCSNHEDQIRRVLADHSSAVRVSWGHAIEERLAPLQAQVDLLVAKFGEPDNGVLAAEEMERWDAFDRGEIDVFESRPERTPQVRAWEEIEDLRRSIDGKYDSYSPTPVVRVTLRGTEPRVYRE
jgi:hypothetical protein